ncbi:hypothetical protein EC844_110112 [Acinetobacter calcoaceticus]|uniref:Uncharacterized protein n=1 Tax=Acinetobacter calcoaceticus TaxID=471 RepID=A0A4R1XVB2_ACICA|nr:hypothetical protein EC844_110112 [Acinetobacter calcoaceticus]
MTTPKILSIIISTLLSSTLLSIFFYFFNQTGKGLNQDGRLYYARSFKVIGLLTLLLPSGLLLMFFMGWYPTDEIFAAIALLVAAGIFAVLALIFCLEVFGVKGHYDQQSISFTTAWSGTKNENWRDIKSLRFNKRMNWYVIQFESGKKIRLSSTLNGHRDVIEFLQQPNMRYRRNLDQ